MGSIKREKHPLNVKIGERIRTARKACGLSQSELGNTIPKSITFQQIQKYETGSNRISISMLCDIAEALQLHLLGMPDESKRGKGIISHVSFGGCWLACPQRTSLLPSIMW